jgi:hypothetical protein
VKGATGVRSVTSPAYELSAFTLSLIWGAAGRNFCVCVHNLTVNKMNAMEMGVTPIVYPNN